MGPFDRETSRPRSWAAMPGYVYLDSNAFWLMKPDHLKHDQEFAETVRDLRRRYRFPFSVAHFLDIMAGDLPGKEAYIEYDLAFLAEASQGHAVDLDEDERRPPEQVHPVPGPMPGNGLPWIVHYDYERSDVAAQYRRMPKDAPAQPSFRVIGSSHQVDLAKVSNHHPMKPLLEMADGMLSPEVLKGYLEILWASRDDPDVYKAFRKSVVEACGQIGAEGTFLTRETAERLGPLRALMAAETTEEIALTLGPAADALASMRGMKFDDLRWPARLVNSYHLLAFHTDLWDKINKGNRPSNMRRDATHLTYAAGAKHFVTCDGRFAAKAKVAFSAFGITTRVSDLSQFKALFS